MPRYLGIDRYNTQHRVVTLLHTIKQTQHNNDNMSTTVNNGLVEDITSFYRDWCHDDIAKFAQHYPKDEQTLHIRFDHLRKAMPDLADDFLESPEHVEEHLEVALEEFDLPVPVDLSGATVRVTGLSDAAEEFVHDVGAYEPGDVAEDFTIIRGQVSKQTAPKIRPTEAVYRCLRCDTINRLHQPPNEELQEPHECKGCERQGPFRTLTDEMAKTGVNTQLVRLQRPPEKTGEHADDTLDVVLEEDLVRAVEPGDRVAVGADIRTILDEGGDNGPELDFMADAHTVDKQEVDFEDIDFSEYEPQIEAIANSDDPFRDIVDSILPSHEGDELIKEAIAYQLFGGVPKELPDGTEIRGSIHIFLVGDPGTGKSTLMRYVDNLAPRSVYTSGSGSTSAGLSAAAVQDDFGDGGWTLEAGALVEAHRGVCCVDELDDMDETDRAGMLEAMSEQRITVSKAGINATMPAQTTVLAAANPEMGRFEPYDPISEQLDIHPALLSRFDLMFPLTDKPDAEEDLQVAQHSTTGLQVAGELQRDDGAEVSDDIDPTIEPEVLRAYIAYAREVMPVLTDEAARLIEEEYVNIRGANDDDGAIPTTPRMIQSLGRLAEASARIRLSETVEPKDVDRAIAIYEEYLNRFGIDPETGEFDADVIATGTSKSQRERVRAVKDVVSRLQDKHEHGVPLDTILDHGDLAEYDAEAIQHEIDQLKQKGEMYNPKKGFLRRA